VTRRRVVVTIALSALVLALVAVLPVATPPGSNGVLDVADHQPAGAIYTGTSVTQQFPAGGDAIHTVTVYLATYGRVNRGTLKISVFAESQKAWQRLTTRTIDEATLPDNSYNSLIFSPPLPVTRGGNVRIVLESDSQPTDAVTWWIDPHVQQPGHQLTYNTKAVQGTAVFQVHYEREAHPLILSLGTIWRDATPFLTAPWQAMLLLALVGTIASGALIFRRVPDDDTALPTIDETG